MQARAKPRPPPSPCRRRRPRPRPAGASSPLPGNRPSTTLQPRADAALLAGRADRALYGEHRVWIAALWNINSFDQWGAEWARRSPTGCCRGWMRARRASASVTRAVSTAPWPAC
ncbi:MAG: hypothetical protein U1F49_08350 [Rubrivivax sp.]